MKKGKFFYLALLSSAVVLLSFACSRGFNENTVKTGRLPSISPDYIDITIPPNIAPMNFLIDEEGKSFLLRASSGEYSTDIKSPDGVIQFSRKQWRKLIANSNGGQIEFRVLSTDGKETREYDPFSMRVAPEKIDPYLTYRLIHPGYYSWSDIRIMQRSLESFSEEPVFQNQIMDKNCANCHSFNNNSSDRFLLHIRGSKGGTYFVDNGEITRTDPKIESMPGGATYPSWHPGGRFVAFSSNQVRQSFYSVPEKNIEVFDLVSSLILYDREKNEVININDNDTSEVQMTFPSWSPDGNYIYYCRATQKISFDSPEMDQIFNTHYNLARKPFDPETRTFGETEIVFDAASRGKSVSFPRISPDGRFVVITLADYGTFPVWHQEADLYMIDLQKGSVDSMSVNSSRTESYHSWSENGRWLVFSSRRLDGRSGRPYFAYIYPDGKQGKEFVLPQRDPCHYDNMLQSFNIPELVNGKIKIGPRDLADASRKETLKAKPGMPEDAKPFTSGSQEGGQNKDNQRSIHE